MVKLWLMALCVTVALVLPAAPVEATHEFSGPSGRVFDWSTAVGDTGVRAIVVDSRGRTVLAVHSGNIDGAAAQIIRLGVDGTLDAGFGDQGVASLEIGPLVAPGVEDRTFVLNGMDVDEHDRIVVAGWFPDGRYIPVVLRLDEDGELDTTFGDGGVAIVDFEGFPAWFNDVRVFRDGSVVAVGFVFGYRFSETATSSDFAIARFSADGTLDPTFGNGGIVRVDIDGTEEFQDEATAVAVQPDNRIVVVGTKKLQGGHSNLGVIRLDADGSLDQTFGNQGIVELELLTPGWTHFEGKDVAVRRDGRLMVAGTRFGAGIGGDSALVRLTSAGTLDPSFGEFGTVVAELAAPRIALLPNGKTLLQGWQQIRSFNEDGSVDFAFGTGGLLESDGTQFIDFDPRGWLTSAGSGLRGHAVARRWELNVPILGPGFWLVDEAGSAYNFGEASSPVGTTAPTGNGPVVAGASTRTGFGYWLLTSAGTVLQFGDADHYGDASAVDLAADERWVSIVSPSHGLGYWLITSTGRVSPHGLVDHLGAATGFALDGDIVSASAAATGSGYYLLGRDGGVFTFGTASFHGSIPGMLGGNVLALDWLDAAAVAMTPSASGNGYWVAAADGAVFAFGDALFTGSIPGVLPAGMTLRAPVIDIFAANNGYTLAATDGGIFNFGEVDFVGSLGCAQLSTQITAVIPVPNTTPSPPPLPFAVTGVRFCH